MKREAVPAAPSVPRALRSADPSKVSQWGPVLLHKLQVKQSGYGTTVLSEEFQRSLEADSVATATAGDINPDLSDIAEEVVIPPRGVPHESAYGILDYPLSASRIIPALDMDGDVRSSIGSSILLHIPPDSPQSSCTSRLPGNRISLTQSAPWDNRPEGRQAAGRGRAAREKVRHSYDPAQRRVLAAASAQAPAVAMHRPIDSVVPDQHRGKLYSALSPTRSLTRGSHRLPSYEPTQDAYSQRAVRHDNTSGYGPPAPTHDLPAAQLQLAADALLRERGAAACAPGDGTSCGVSQGTMAADDGAGSLQSSQHSARRWKEVVAPSHPRTLVPWTPARTRCAGAQHDCPSGTASSAGSSLHLRTAHSPLPSHPSASDIVGQSSGHTSATPSCHPSYGLTEMVPQSKCAAADGPADAGSRSAAPVARDTPDSVNSANGGGADGGMDVHAVIGGLLKNTRHNFGGAVPMAAIRRFELHGIPHVTGIDSVRPAALISSEGCASSSSPHISKAPAHEQHSRSEVFHTPASSAASSPR